MPINHHCRGVDGYAVHASSQSPHAQSKAIFALIERVDGIAVHPTGGSQW